MTGPEIDEWLEDLADTDNKRLVSLREMLRNANEDGMTAEDRVICMNALRRLNKKIFLETGERH